MSTPTINEVFGIGLIGRTDRDQAQAPEFDPLKDVTPSEHFSTATWFLPSGRTARSVASAAHCEADLNVSRVRRALLNLSGRKLQEES